eukprot:scaffold6798_cov108-Isochrysis_galbana.AAC.6
MIYGTAADPLHHAKRRPMAAAIAARAVALKHAKAKQTDLARGLELQQARDESEVQLVFDQIDGAGREPTGLLDRDQARVLVQLVIGAAAVDEDAFEMIFPHKTRRRAGSDGADDSVRTVNKADMLVGINNYRFYLDHREIICEMFEKHDANGDMKLGRDELRRAILDSEAAVRLRAVSNGINYVAPERDRREVRARPRQGRLLRFGCSPSMDFYEP